MIFRTFILGKTGKLKMYIFYLPECKEYFENKSLKKGNFSIIVQELATEARTEP